MGAVRGQCRAVSTGCPVAISGSHRCSLAPFNECVIQNHDCVRSRRKAVCWLEDDCE